MVLSAQAAGFPSVLLVGAVFALTAALWKWELFLIWTQLEREKHYLDSGEMKHAKIQRERWWAREECDAEALAMIFIYSEWLGRWW